jgi:hypothetical protein
MVPANKYKFMNYFVLVLDDCVESTCLARVRKFPCVLGVGKFSEHPLIYSTFDSGTIVEQ